MQSKNEKKCGCHCHYSSGPVGGPCKNVHITSCEHCQPQKEEKLNKRELHFIPDEDTSCDYCGISSFAHIHPKNTLPKDFWKESEPCDMIVSPRDQLTNLAIDNAQRTLYPIDLITPTPLAEFKLLEERVEALEEAHVKCGKCGVWKTPIYGSSGSYCEC